MLHTVHSHISFWVDLRGLGSMSADKACAAPVGEVDRGEGEGEEGGGGVGGGSQEGGTHGRTGGGDRV